MAHPASTNPFDLVPVMLIKNYLPGIKKTQKKKFCLIFFLIGIIKLVVVFSDLLVLLKVDLVPEQPADATKAFDKLGALLGSVGDKLEGGAKIFVVFGEPLHQQLLVDDLGFAAVLALLELGLPIWGAVEHHHQDNEQKREKMYLCCLLLLGQEDRLFLASGVVLDNVTHDVEVFPNDQGLHRAHVEGLERVAHTKAVAASVL